MMEVEGMAESDEMTEEPEALQVSASLPAAL